MDDKVVYKFKRVDCSAKGIFVLFFIILIIFALLKLVY